MGRPRKMLDTPTDIRDLTIVAYAEDAELAEFYKRMLLDNNIPTAVKTLPESEKTQFSNIAVMVPLDFVDQAYSMLAQHAVGDDLFDTLFDSSERILNDEE